MSAQESIPRRRALGYGRVSSRGQEQNCSLETQERAIREYAAARGYELVDFVTEAETAIDEDLGARPVLSGIRQRIRQGEADALLIYKVDRVFRNQYQPAALLPELRQHGAALEFILERFEDTPIGRFSLQAMAFAAELEHGAIRERTIRGRRESLETYKRLPPARWPLYGYQFVRTPNKRGQLVIAAYEIDPVTSRIVLRIYRAYLAGRATNAIACQLTEDGVPTPGGLAGPWHRVMVRNVLTHPAYMGAARARRYTKVRTANGKKSTRLRPESDHYLLPDSTIPALVTPEEWAAVQRRIEANKQMAVRNNRQPNATLLRAGFARCAYCRLRDGARGYALTAMSAGPHSPLAYRCQRLLPDGTICGNRIQARVLDEAVWAHVKFLLTHPEVIRRYFEQLAGEDPTTGELAGITVALREAEREQGNLVANLARVTGPAADVVAAALDAKARAVQALQRQREAALARREIWHREQAQLRLVEGLLEVVAAASGPFADDLTISQRREILLALGLSVEVRREDDPYPNGLRWAIGEDLSAAVGTAMDAADWVKNHLTSIPQSRAALPSFVLRWEGTTAQALLAGPMG